MRSTLKVMGIVMAAPMGLLISVVYESGGPLWPLIGAVGCGILVGAGFTASYDDDIGGN